MNTTANCGSPTTRTPITTATSMSIILSLRITFLTKNKRIHRFSPNNNSNIYSTTRRITPCSNQSSLNYYQQNKSSKSITFLHIIILHLENFKDRPSVNSIDSSTTTYSIIQLPLSSPPNTSSPILSASNGT